MDDVLREDSEKAASLEEVIEELERLQHSEAEKAKELQLSQQMIQVMLLGLQMCGTKCVTHGIRRTASTCVQAAMAIPGRDPTLFLTGSQMLGFSKS